MSVNSKLINTLPAPPLLASLPASCQWLSGEGAGSWFNIIQVEQYYEISRFSPEGLLECKGIFQILNHEKFKIQKPFKFIHLSHCQKVNLIQDSVHFSMLRLA